MLSVGDDGASAELVVGGRRTPIDRARLTLGQDHGNDVVLDDRTVSRVHAVIDQIGNAHLLTDLGSRNGTTVGSAPVVAPRVLRSGDEIGIGRVRLVYLGAPAASQVTEPLAPAPSVTARERDVLLELCRPLAAGSMFTEPAASADIAAALFVSEAAVRMHLSRLYSKFGIAGTDQRPRALLASRTLELGVVTPAELVSRRSGVVRG